MVNVEKPDFGINSSLEKRDLWDINKSIADILDVTELLEKRDFFKQEIKEFLDDDISKDTIKRSYLMNLAYYFLFKIRLTLKNTKDFRGLRALLHNLEKRKSYDFALDEKEKIMKYLKKYKNSWILFNEEKVEVISIIDLEQLELVVKKIYLFYKKNI